MFAAPFSILMALNVNVAKMITQKYQKVALLPFLKLRNDFYHSFFQLEKQIQTCNFIRYDKLYMIFIPMTSIQGCSLQIEVVFTTTLTNNLRNKCNHPNQFSSPYCFIGSIFQILPLRKRF